MGYGITSESQIIDIATIKSGCNAYRSVLPDFDACGNLVNQAGQTCNLEALSIDNTSLQYPICELGDAVKNLKTEYNSYVDEVLAQAQQVYNAQYAEYQAYLDYLRSLEEQQRSSGK